MAKKFMSLLAAMAFVGGTATLFAEARAAAPTVAEGTLKIQDKNYPLIHALAYETTSDKAESIAVVLSGQAISGEKLREAMEEEKTGRDSGFNRPYLKLEFTKAGAFRKWSAGAGPATMSPGRRAASGELKLQDGRVSGKASQPYEPGGMLPAGFDVRFDVALLSLESLPAAGAKKPPGPAANVKPSVTGVFKGNGKEAKLAYVSAHWREPFSDKPSMVLVFTEKDHSKEKKPDFKAAFGEFGSALIISLHEAGNIFGCQVVHTAHQKKGFSSIGQIKTNNFKFADGQVEGELTTDGKLEFFGETWEVNVKFVAPLGEIPPEFQPADPKKPRKTATDEPATRNPTIKPTTAKPDEKPAPRSAEGQLNVKDLALTKDATDFDYKALVGHLSFKSKSDVKSVCAELTTKLTAQGWAIEGRDLITPTSSILKRKRGDASLTIFVKPEDSGSQVKMFTKGLAWEGK